MDLPFAADGRCRFNAGVTFLCKQSVRRVAGEFDIKVTYTGSVSRWRWPTSIPFVVHPYSRCWKVRPEYEEAAETLGATRWQSFRKVVLPELSPALMAEWRCRLP